MTEDKLLTINEAAEYLRVSRTTIYRLFSEGELEPLSVGNRYRVRLSDIDRNLERDTHIRPAHLA